MKNDPAFSAWPCGWQGDGQAKQHWTVPEERGRKTQRGHIRTRRSTQGKTVSLVLGQKFAENCCRYIYMYIPVHVWYKIDGVYKLRIYHWWSWKTVIYIWYMLENLIKQCKDLFVKKIKKKIPVNLCSLKEFSRHSMLLAMICRYL